MATIPSQTNFPTAAQVPGDAILQIFGKATYLGNQYVAAVKAVTVGASEIPVMLLSNANGNKVSMFEDLINVVSGTTGNSVTLNFYSAPTVTTVGTALVPVNMRLASGSTSVMTITTTPTISANGTFIGSLSGGFNVQNVDSLLRILDPGQKLLITAIASAASTSVSYCVSWYEI